jgi:hypothetical protein
MAKKSIHKTSSIVIGNGTSRLGKNIKQWEKSKDVNVIACNWFFKEEFRPHILITSDEPITKSIREFRPNYARSNHWYSWFAKPGSGIKKSPTPEKFGAGAMGTYVAASEAKSNTVFLVGMDFFGFGGTNAYNNGQLNNIYGGKKHYVPSDSPAPTYRNWQRRFEYTLDAFPNVDFYHVNPFEGKSPERLRGKRNFHTCTFENMEAYLNKGEPLVDTLEKTMDDLLLAESLNPDNVRAALERQIAGQENIIFKDLLDPKQVLRLIMDGRKRYEKNPKGYVTCTVMGFDNITIPCLQVKDRNGKVRVANEKEAQAIVIRDMQARQKLQAESGIIPQDLSKHPEFSELLERQTKPNNDLPEPPQFG